MWTNRSILLSRPFYYLLLTKNRFGVKWNDLIFISTEREVTFYFEYLYSLGMYKTIISGYQYLMAQLYLKFHIPICEILPQKIIN